MTTIAVEYIWTSPDNSHGHVSYILHYDDGRVSFMRQPFRRGAYGDGLWGWDGREPITLSPSFACEDKMTGAKVHLFLRSALIDLCDDSNVEVEPHSAVKP